MGVVYLPMVVVVTALLTLARHLPMTSQLLSLAGDRSGTGVLAVLTFGALPNVISYLVVNAAASHSAAQIEAGEPESFIAAYHAVWQRARDLGGGVVRAILIVGLLFASVVGIPWGIRQLVRYQFLGQVTMLEGKGRRAALDRSSELVRGRWWHTAVVVAFINVGLFAIGLSVGLLLLVLIRSLPLWGFIALIWLIYGALVPLGAIAIGAALRGRDHRGIGEAVDGPGKPKLVDA